MYYTNCPLVSASNVDQELGWTREEFKKIGVTYAFLRSRRENDWYPHYIHNLADNLIRFGGMFPPIAVHADLRRTVLLGATNVYEGGCMLVRARDDVFKMSDLKGKKIGLTKNLNTIKNDWWRIQEEAGIEMMLRLNDMTRDDVESLKSPYPDDWYDDPKMLEPLENPSGCGSSAPQARSRLPSARNGTRGGNGGRDLHAVQRVPAPFQEATGKFKAIEDLSRYPDWTVQAVANVPAVITCTQEMAENHPDLVVTFMKGMIKVGRWANEHKHAAAAILDKQTFYLDVEDTYQGIEHVDMVPNLSAQNLTAIEVGKDFMLSHGYIKRDFDVREWAAPSSPRRRSTKLLKSARRKARR